MPSQPPKTASLEFEQALWSAGCRHVFGFDEAGRGAWAGPVSAAVVCLPPDQPSLAHVLQGVFDSKQVGAAQREALVARIHAYAMAWGIGDAGPDEIDAYGIVPATHLAMRRALEAAQMHSACPAPDHLLLDALRWRWDNTPYTAIIRGDSASLTIAAASILAKVHRDALMRQLDAEVPGYGFSAHKGYGTAGHQAALRLHGPSPAHRMSFSPLRTPLL